MMAQFIHLAERDGWWSAVFAGLGVVASFVVAYLTSRQQTRAFRASMREQRSGLRLSWTSNVVEWGQCCLRTLSQIDALALLPVAAAGDTFEIDKHRALHMLSSLIDEGRFFFINKPRGDYGSAKPAAYRGLAPRLLDCLKLVYRRVSQEGHSRDDLKKLRSLLIDARREFVSELQAEIDPRWIKRATDYQAPPSI